MNQDHQVFENSDKFWDTFWNHLDKAEEIVCITTYGMDHSMIAGITL